MKVLIVDDSRTDRELIGDVVTTAGHQVLYAEDGDSALSKAGKARPDFVFLDIIMPGTDGFITCKRMRRELGMDDTPIVMVSSKNQTSDQFWAQRQGATAYITKPFDDKGILDALAVHGS